MKTDQLLNGKYKIIKKIQEGGQASLFLAVIENDSIEFRKNVAIKYFNKDERTFDEFRNEVKHLCELDHPNIASIFDAGIENEKPYIVLDYIDGLNLKELSEKIKSKELKLNSAEVLEILEKILDALIYAHNFKPKQILHRDVSPANIMISKEGNVKLLDFGISGIAAERLAGKISYLPSSLIERKFPYNESIDLYSLGIVIYEIISQKKVKGESDLALKDIEDKSLRLIIKKLTDYKNSNGAEILREVKHARLGRESNLRFLMAKACDDNFIIETTKVDFSSQIPEQVRVRKSLFKVGLTVLSLVTLALFTPIFLNRSLKSNINLGVKTPLRTQFLKSKFFDFTNPIKVMETENYSINACENYCYQNLFGASVGQHEFYLKLQTKEGLKNKLQGFDHYFLSVLQIYDESRKSFEKVQNKCNKARACSTLVDLYRYIDLQLPNYKDEIEYQSNMKRIIGGGDSEYAKLAKSFTDFELKRIGHDYKFKFIPNGLGTSINKIEINEVLNMDKCRDIGDEAFLVHSRYKEYESKAFNLFDFEVFIFNKKSNRGKTPFEIELVERDLMELQACHYKRSYGKIVVLDMLEIQ